MLQASNIFFHGVSDVDKRESRFVLYPALFTEQIITPLNKGASRKLSFCIQMQDAVTILLRNECTVQG